MTVETISRSAAYLTKTNIVHPIVEARPDDYEIYIAAREDAARAAIGDALGVEVSGGSIETGVPPEDEE